MGVASKAPPKEKPKGRSKPKAAGEAPWKVEEGKRVRGSKALPHELRLREFLLGTAAMAKVADEFTGTAIELKAEELAYGWAKLAQEDPRVSKALSMLFEGSAWAEAVIPTASLALMILWHYEILVPNKLGATISFANGMLPVTRGEEKKMRDGAEPES